VSDTDNINEIPPQMDASLPNDHAAVEQPEDFYEEPIYQTYEENVVMASESTFPRNDADMPVATVYTDVTSFLRVILSNLWLIILVAVVGTALSYLYISRQTPVYESSASVIIEPSSTADDLTRIQADIIRISGTNVQGTYVQFLESRRIQEAAVAELDEQYDPQLLEDAEIEIIPVSNSAVIDILVRSTNTELARALANEVIEVGGTQSPQAYLAVYELGVLNPADLPEIPVAPAIATSTILGALGSLAVGIALAFLVDSYRQYRRNTPQLSR
jgi:capsular polysaccharide biosynthesis protein